MTRTRCRVPHTCAITTDPCTGKPPIKADHCDYETIQSDPALGHHFPDRDGRRRFVDQLYGGAVLDHACGHGAYHGRFDRSRSRCQGHETPIRTTTGVVWRQSRRVVHFANQERALQGQVRLKPAAYPTAVCSGRRNIAAWHENANAGI
jgi:hypothetical protein